jgi:hypothetical protein
MSDYIVVRGVPILDEHVIRDDDGHPIAHLNAKRLEKIAERNNKRIQETGDLIPIIVGHTKGEVGEYVPEEDQPEIVGYAGRLSVGPLFRTGRRAIKATFKFFRNQLHKIRLYPRRSVELWLSDWKIDPISLLGATTPERDLGLLQLSRYGLRQFNGNRYYDLSIGAVALLGASAPARDLGLLTLEPVRYSRQRRLKMSIKEPRDVRRYPGRPELPTRLSQYPESQAGGSIPIHRLDIDELDFATQNGITGNTARKKAEQVAAATEACYQRYKERQKQRQVY